ncbi:hypothetical protein D3C78_1863800 [compost metagenome]
MTASPIAEKLFAVNSTYAMWWNAMNVGRARTIWMAAMVELSRPDQPERLSRDLTVSGRSKNTLTSSQTYSWFIAISSP